jgi:hypothetical protein
VVHTRANCSSTCCQRRPDLVNPFGRGPDLGRVVVPQLVHHTDPGAEPRHAHPVLRHLDRGDQLPVLGPGGIQVVDVRAPGRQTYCGRPQLHQAVPPACPDTSRI